MDRIRLKSRRVAISVLAWLLLSGQAAPVYKVLKVSDGDTVTIVCGTAKSTVRLAGIDAPEKAQPYGPEAAAHLRVLLDVPQVTLKAHSTDRYGRTVAYLYTPKGLDVSLSMLADGYAWHYDRYNADTAYANAQSRAQLAGIGIWQQSAPEAPWSYRKRR